MRIALTIATLSVLALSAPALAQSAGDTGAAPRPMNNDAGMNEGRATAPDQGITAPNRDNGPTGAPLDRGGSSGAAGAGGAAAGGAAK